HHIIETRYSFLPPHLLLLLLPPPPSCPLFPYTTLFRSQLDRHDVQRLGVMGDADAVCVRLHRPLHDRRAHGPLPRREEADEAVRSEEHTSELQSRGHLVCRLLLEKKKRSRGQD